MRKNSGNILLVILVTVSLLAASVGGYFWWTAKSIVPSIETINWKTYYANGYSIKYPSNLKLCLDYYNLIFLNFENLGNDCVLGNDYESIYERDLVNNHPTYKEKKIRFSDGIIKIFYKILPGNAQRRAYAEVLSDYKKFYLGIYGPDENTFKLFDQILSTFRFD